MSLPSLGTLRVGIITTTKIWAGEVRGGVGCGVLCLSG